MTASQSLSSPVKVLLLDLGREASPRHACIADLARFLSRLPDFSPMLAVPASSPLCAAARERGLTLCALPSSLTWDPRSRSRLLRLVHPGEPCLVHSHDPGGAALACAFTRRRPSALMLHTLYSAPPPGKASRKDCWRKAQVLVAISESLRAACRHAELDPEHIRHIRPGLDPERCPPRQERGDGRLVFFTPAPEGDPAGWNMLINSLAILEGRDTLPPWELRVAGQSAHLPALLELARSLGVEQRLALFGGQNHYNFLSQADVLLAPSEDALEALTAMQAGWAAELPVVAAALPANLELLFSGNNGLAYPADPAALAGQLERLALDPALRRALVSGGRSSLAAVTAERAAEEHARLYRALLASRMFCNA